MDKSNHQYTTKLNPQCLILTTDYRACYFILVTIKDMLVRHLKITVTFYNKFAAKELVNHLAKRSSGLDTINFIALQTKMTSW